MHNKELDTVSTNDCKIKFTEKQAKNSYLEIESLLVKVRG